MLFTFVTEQKEPNEGRLSHTVPRQPEHLVQRAGVGMSGCAKGIPSGKFPGVTRLVAIT